MPAAHRLVARHQPQPVAFVQVPQLVWAAQLPHVFDEPNCHEGHEPPVVGPLELPGTHVFLLGHQPHPAVAAHVEHVVCLAHVAAGVVGVVVGGVVVVPHCEMLHVQRFDAQVEPVSVGPNQFPDQQRFVFEHQPQPVPFVQVAQVE